MKLCKLIIGAHRQPADYTLCVCVWKLLRRIFEVKFFQPQTKQNDPSALLPPLACAGNCFLKAFFFSLSRSHSNFRGAKRKLFYFFTPPSKLPARSHILGMRLFRPNYTDTAPRVCSSHTAAARRTSRSASNLSLYHIHSMANSSIHITRHNENNQAQATIIWRAQTTPTFDLPLGVWAPRDFLLRARQIDRKIGNQASRPQRKYPICPIYTERAQ